jgi:hypothetical protein
LVTNESLYPDYGIIITAIWNLSIDEK